MQAPPEPAGTTEQAAGAVSCSSSSACMAIAVNAYPHSVDLGTFAETWDGSHWTVRAVPNGKNDATLNGVKCRSARWCVAAGAIKAVPPTGDDYVPVADRWNGITWTQAAMPGRRKGPGRSGCWRSGTALGGQCRRRCCPRVTWRRA
jgi:hypothetical protein